MTELDMDFQGGDAGASATYPSAAGNIKKGGFVMLKNRPCKVVDVSTSKTGKHGHAKANIVGIDIFTGKKLEDMCPTSHNVDVPIVTRVPYMMVSCESDGFTSLMDLTTNTMREDLGLPQDDPALVELVRSLLDAGKQVHVTVIKACNQEKIIEAKEATGGS